MSEDLLAILARARSPAGLSRAVIRRRYHKALYPIPGDDPEWRLWSLYAAYSAADDRLREAVRSGHVEQTGEGRKARFRLTDEGRAVFDGE